MNRRDLMLALCSLAVSPKPAFSQQPNKVWQIGLLHFGAQDSFAQRLEVFKQAFSALGYTEGRDYVLIGRFADGDDRRLPTLAAELIRLNPDVIMGPSLVTVRLLKKTTATIPIVMINVGDPVGSGLVTDLARPGGNVTGTSNSLTDITPKHLELIHEIVPKRSRIAVMVHPDSKSHADALKTLRELASKIDVSILPIETRSPQEIEKGFVLIKKQGGQAVIVVNHQLYIEQRQQVAELAMKAGLPCTGYTSEYADAGFLISYGRNTNESYRRTAAFVSKILKGTHPSELPVEQPTKFEMVINLKTAKAIGLKIPNLILVRADRVIE